MKSVKTNQEIADKLTKLPKLVDTTDKEEFYQRISSRINNKNVDMVKSSKRNILIPSFGIGFVMMIVIILIPVLLNDTGYDEAKNMKSNSNEVSNSDIEEARFKMDDSIQDDNMQLNKAFSYTEPHSYVIDSIDNDEQLIYAALADNEVQYIVPLTIVVPNTEEISYYYSQLDMFIDGEELGLADYLFKDIEFDISLKKNEVVMNLPASFSIDEGSTAARIFGEVLAAMFLPYQIDKVKLKIFNNEKIDLGPIGMVEELTLSQVPLAYKRYQVPNEEHSFLIPLQQDIDANIDHVLIELKQNDEMFDVYATIPKELELTATTTAERLIITIINDEILANEQQFVTMIESILMSAKSFGFEFVQFENAGIDQVGTYQLSEPIPVPLAVNPIDFIQ